MATELVTFKMDAKFLKEVDESVKKSNFENRTEFIRAALREKVDEIELKETMQRLSYLKGASKKKTSDEEYERNREMAFEEISKRFNIK